MSTWLHRDRQAIYQDPEISPEIREKVLKGIDAMLTVIRPYLPGTKLKENAKEKRLDR
jgi:hypothetical protein